MRLSVAVPVAVIALVLAGCGSSSSGGNDTVSITQSANGSTITVAKGEKIVVTLPGTAWTLDSLPATGPLIEQSDQVTSGKTSNTTAVFQASSKGTGDIVGVRSSCGSHRCSASESTFGVHVTISA